MIARWVNKVWSWIVDLVGSIWHAVTTFLLDLVAGLLDVVLSVAESVVQSIPVPSSWQTAGDPLAGLPGQVLYLLNAVGIPEFLGIVGAGYGVRFLLNLIPAALTRV